MQSSRTSLEIFVESKAVVSSVFLWVHLLIPGHPASQPLYNRKTTKHPLTSSSFGRYYAYKIGSQAVLLYAASCAAAVPGVIGFVVGSVLLGLFWQQSGWLCHDICHNQLCEMKDGRANTMLNRYVVLNRRGTAFRLGQCR